MARITSVRSSTGTSHASWRFRCCRGLSWSLTRTAGPPSSARRAVSASTAPERKKVAGWGSRTGIELRSTTRVPRVRASSSSSSSWISARSRPRCPANEPTTTTSCSFWPMPGSAPDPSVVPPPTGCSGAWEPVWRFAFRRASKVGIRSSLTQNRGRATGGPGGARGRCRIVVVAAAEIREGGGDHGTSSEEH